MEYHYFVSYSHENGFGRCAFKSEQEIKSIEDIEKIEKYMQQANGFRVAVISYQLMRIHYETNEPINP